MTEPDADLPASSPPSRRRFVLARLASAVRRQDWFAVALEVLIVVLGIVIGFQVTGWGQARADRAQEQAYLRQLAADLRETQQIVAHDDSLEAVASQANAALFHAFYQPDPPGADSLTDLLRISNALMAPQPVLSTAQALVATGDLTLIRDDSLRSAVTRYLDGSRSMLDSQAAMSETWRESLATLWRRVDPNAVTATVPDALLDSLARDGFFFLPRGPRVDIRPIEREAFLADEVARVSLYEMLRAKRNTFRYRQVMHEDAAAVLRRVEAHIDR